MGKKRGRESGDIDNTASSAVPIWQGQYPFVGTTRDVDTTRHTHTRNKVLREFCVLLILKKFGTVPVPVRVVHVKC